MKHSNMRNLISVVLLVPGLSTAAPPGEEYFGEFLDALRGIFNTKAQPRPTFKLESEYRFMDPNGLLWKVPSGVEVDGASIPQQFWSLIGGPFEGPYINASVIHDYYCDTEERTAHDTHRNFYYGMRAAGVPEWKAITMYWVVITFGPSWRLEKRVTLENHCQTLANGDSQCFFTPVIKEAMVRVPPADLSNPVVLAVALAKTSAIARNLVTSDGEILDVKNDTVIAATLDNIDKNAQDYRSTFVQNDFFSSPKALGILSTAPTKGLAAIEPWEGNRIPKLAETAPLTSTTLAHKADNKPFKLDSSSEGLIEKRIDLESLEAEVRFKKGGVM